MLQRLREVSWGSAGLPTPPKCATAGLPYRVPLPSRSDAGVVGDLLPSAKSRRGLRPRRTRDPQVSPIAFLCHRGPMRAGSGDPRPARRSSRGSPTPPKRARRSPPTRSSSIAVRLRAGSGTRAHASVPRMCDTRLESDCSTEVREGTITRTSSVRRDAGTPHLWHWARRHLRVGRGASAAFHAR